MLVHAHRHLPYTQRPHTRCLPHTRSLTHTPCLTPTRLFAHACRFWRTRGLFHLRCPFHTRRAGKHALRPHHSHMGSLSHTGSLPHSGFHSYLSPHTPGHSRWGLALPLGVPGSPYPPSSACTRSQHSSPRPRKDRPDPPGHDPLQGSTASPSVPEGGYPAARPGSPHALRALPHCPPLPLCVCVCVSNPVFTV